eukprot:CAMPEP_0171913398 /NCGR_PEP_ID=MMETSP0993-20121228/11703_1 /TAXON_ID=483369 /ORGANISM="non described non described, Strain CCMP2098" /LENGTH=105 /DNA_ID=CAMNT_0012547377 /DNA_START=156 /DNA_END=473 /DNA_ORIENTATION=-
MAAAGPAAGAGSGKHVLKACAQRRQDGAPLNYDHADSLVDHESFRVSHSGQHRKNPKNRQKQQKLVPRRQILTHIKGHQLFRSPVGFSDPLFKIPGYVVQIIIFG